MDYFTQTKLSFFFLLLSVFLVELGAVTPPPTNRKPSTASPPNAASSVNFKSPLAGQFVVPPRLPGVPFPIQQSYAGRLNVSVNPRQVSQMFFWLVPADDAGGSKDLTIWVNGDACSGLVGAFQGTGPITMNPGRVPTKNPNSWTRSSNMLYLDIPLNIGFTRGQATQRGSADIGGLVFNFLTAFLKVFPEMNGLNLYMAGHAYSGTYISYAADKIYALQSKLALKLQGILLINAFISTPDYQQHIPIASYVTKNNDAFKFTPAQLKHLQATDNECGFSQYLAQHLTFPPRGVFPQVTKAVDPAHAPDFKEQCMIFMEMFQGSSPDMNLGNIHDKPGMADPNFTKFVYPGRADVQSAFNVDGARRWAPCGDFNKVFPNGDASPPPTLKALPNVINHSKRTVIAHGLLDGTLPVDGMKLAIQSMTWGGKQGFQQSVNSKFVVGGKYGGRYHTERGLTFVEVAQSGSFMPHDQGQAALSIFEYLLGKRPTP
ncbi:hypothetical protein PGTUg99_016285 [Puccinia graminis f. sp. tritici]|uniref:Uncharacterized protein n=1 Tax=Puccinia graminis f. sp. tritici TaxID=56615 RepID=A0A5B0MSN0_PUCGR|nr:hypothetical protein PGTUg99_016285 [Puccinia graminis f. sp. tritici]